MVELVENEKEKISSSIAFTILEYGTEAMAKHQQHNSSEADTVRTERILGREYACITRAGSKLKSSPHR